MMTLNEENIKLEIVLRECEIDELEDKLIEADEQGQNWLAMLIHEVLQWKIDQALQIVLSKEKGNG